MQRSQRGSKTLRAEPLPSGLSLKFLLLFDLSDAWQSDFPPSDLSYTVCLPTEVAAVRPGFPRLNTNYWKRGRRSMALIEAKSESVGQTPAQTARVAIVLYSLFITGGLLVFLLLAGPFGMRFENEENLRLFDVVLPTFLGYLGAASHFLFNANRGREVVPQNVGMLRILVHAPFLIFIVSVAAMFYAHYYTHLPLGPNDPRVEPFTFNQLSRSLSVSLAVLAATIGIISSYLFGPPPASESQSSPPSILREDTSSSSSKPTSVSEGH
jgi:hypothetical protein